MKAPRLLVVDAAAQSDAPWSRLDEVLTFSEPPRVTASMSDAAEQVAAGHFDVAVVVHRDDQPTADCLDQLRQLDSELELILVAGGAVDAGLAAACVRNQLRELLVEPVSTADLAEAIKRASQERQSRRETELLRRREEALADRMPGFIGGSEGMQKVFDTIRQVAKTDVDVLILGETGTGKELVARSVHQESRRAEQPFVAVDCGAIPENLMESEFFGHERGAFTGADKKRTGLIQFADGGTLFLDEIGELPLLLQSKLLRVLQERVLRLVGGREEVPVDVRIVAATSRNLDEMIREKRFREDLYYRINVVRLELPPLRKRGDDIGLLIEYFAARFSREMGKPVVGVSPEAYQVLREYHWPGNVRELQNVMRRGIALCQTSLIRLEDLPDELVAQAGAHIHDESDAGRRRGFFAERDHHMAVFEKQYLSELLKRHHGNVKAAAMEADVPRGTLYRLIKNHGLESADYR
ncbi:MAG: sigma-54-dependent Fis family transcriptional regulator [Planctomycetaceae bacterium]|nr:sigma-54-dependent Fis family transcriptional regulator [Planctomycetaceae bacterium]